MSRKAPKYALDSTNLRKTYFSDLSAEHSYRDAVWGRRWISQAAANFQASVGSAYIEIRAGVYVLCWFERIALASLAAAATTCSDRRSTRGVIYRTTSEFSATASNLPDATEIDRSNL